MELHWSLMYFAPWLLLAYRRNTARPAYREVLPLGLFCCGVSFAASMFLRSQEGDPVWSALLGSVLGLLVALLLSSRAATDAARASAPPAVAHDEARKSGAALSQPTSDTTSPWAGPKRIVEERSNPWSLRKHPGFAAPSPQQSAQPQMTGPRRVVEEKSSPWSLRKHPGFAVPGPQHSTRPQRAEQTFRQASVVEVTKSAVAKGHPGFSGSPLRSPSADASRRGMDAGHDLNIDDWRPESFLKRLGYSVGVNGPTPMRRRDALMRAYERPLPDDMPSDYRQECGDPASSKRLQRIVDHLRGRISLAEQRQADMSQALSDWKSDLRWLKQELGKHHRRVDFGKI